MNPQFVGENLLPGQIGQWLAIASFVAALFSSFAYFRAAQTEKFNAGSSGIWLRLGRNGFIVHAAAVIGIFGVLYYIITRHLFEYHYAWSHSDRSLSMKYLLSCFWEGQEGSFMLWSFWHAILGIIVMRTAKGLESRTMSVIALVQTLLATMVLGFYLSPEIRIGSTPFALLRNVMQDAPVFTQPNYLSLIKDGNGLNVLLQNYWMVIHPPILFLGFALTLIPFAYTIAALWKGDLQGWIAPAQKWCLATGGVLGLGIMMGGAWAYESLTFGGYWAWDPVENASLVPWLTLVAGLHTLIVFKVTGRSLAATVFFLFLTYLLVWYSTFLTRTGILGDTSVHAFTGEGKSLSWHLVIVMGILISICTGLLVKRWKALPRVKGEEGVLTREFWMFIGSFVLLLSAAHIILVTSIPVWAPLAKWITGKEVAPPTDPVTSYNDVQVWVAVVIGMLSGSVLFMKFKKTDPRTAWVRLGIAALPGVGLTLLIAVSQHIDKPQLILMLFAASFTLCGMVYYAIRVQKGKILKMGAALTHFGFAMMLIGMILSGYKKEVISYNTMGWVLPLGKKTDAENARESAENSILFRGVPVAMGDYFVTYFGDSMSVKDPRTFYKVRFDRYGKDKQVEETFMLYPDAFVNPKGQGGQSANPDSRHYLNRDIFTYINTSIDKKKILDTLAFIPHQMKPNDTVHTATGYLQLEALERFEGDARFTPSAADIAAVAARLRFYDSKGRPGEVLRPVYSIRENEVIQIDDTLEAHQIYTRFGAVDPATGSVQLGVRELAPQDDYLVLKALVFPYINLLWFGVIIMVAGFILALINRIIKGKKA